MKPNPPTADTATATERRRQAEARLKDRKSAVSGPQSALENERLLHELQVHQLELELQNDELQKTLQDLEVVSAQYTDLYDFAPVAYLKLDEGGHITQANLAAATLLGTERARLMGKRLALFVAEADWGGFAECLRKALAGGPQQSCEVALVACATEERHALLTATRSTDDGERLLALVDITARRQAQNALQESEALLRAIIDHEPECVKVVSPEGRLLEMNPAGIRMIEADSPEQVLHRKIFPLIVKEHRDAFRSLLAKVLQGESGELEFGITGLKGTRRTLETHATPLHNAAGEIIALLGITRDITVRKQMESQLRLLEASVVQLNDALIITEADALDDREPRIVFVNEAAERLTGYTRAELIGRTSRMFQSPKTDRAGLDRIATALRERKSVHAELINHTKAGTEYWSEVNITPVESDTGEVSHFVAIERDITARKAAEAEISRLNSELEQRVSERTAELQAVNQELEAFSYSVSHDLRAPLRHLTGFAELLQKNDHAKLDDRARRHLTFISESAVRMGQLIDDLLAFSRSGRTEFRKVPVNLEALVQEVIQSLRPGTRGRRIVWQMAPLPVVHADANLLRAVLTNLLANALKFTQPRAEATIQIGCTENEHEHIFFIRDNGVGFDMQYVEKLFGVFQRLHAQEEFEGTGIGLANVRRIVSRHGGRTWAESVLNEGATFYFSLPKPTETKHAETKPT
jgi:PAS domain S-box-containing protein